MASCHECHDLTVADLLSLLSEYPSDMLVAVDGYEGGSTTWINVEVKKAKLMTMPSWEGEYQRTYGKERGVKLLVLSRGDRPGA